MMFWGCGVKENFGGLFEGRGFYDFLWGGGGLCRRKFYQECFGTIGGRGRFRQVRRYKTCFSSREISKVMVFMVLGMFNEGGCSEDELLEKCIQFFGERFFFLLVFLGLRLGLVFIFLGFDFVGYKVGLGVCGMGFNYCIRDKRDVCIFFFCDAEGREV